MVSIFQASTDAKGCSEAIAKIDIHVERNYGQWMRSCRPVEEGVASGRPS